MSDENNQIKASTHSKVQLYACTQCFFSSSTYLVSDVAAAAIAFSMVKDLIDAGHLSQSMNYLSVDPNKIRRGKEKVHKDATVKEELKATEEDIICISYDGRKDLT